MFYNKIATIPWIFVGNFRGLGIVTIDEFSMDGPGQVTSFVGYFIPSNPSSLQGGSRYHLTNTDLMEPTLPKTSPKMMGLGKR